jgi:hypothetical protein
MNANEYLKKSRELMMLAERMMSGKERDRLIQEAEELGRRAHSAGWGRGQSPSSRLTARAPPGGTGLPQSGGDS